MSQWITISEAADMFGVSKRWLLYLASGRPETEGRAKKPAVLRNVKIVPYGKRNMYFLNIAELNRILGVKR